MQDLEMIWQQNPLKKLSITFPQIIGNVSNFVIFSTPIVLSAAMYVKLSREVAKRKKIDEVQGSKPGNWRPTSR
jgi:large-conductance mechanosensitive channel